MSDKEQKLLTFTEILQIGYFQILKWNSDGNSALMSESQFGITNIVNEILLVTAENQQKSWFEFVLYW